MSLTLWPHRGSPLQKFPPKTEAVAPALADPLIEHIKAATAELDEAVAIAMTDALKEEEYQKLQDLLDLSDTDLVDALTEASESASPKIGKEACNTAIPKIIDYCASFGRASAAEVRSTAAFSKALPKERVHK